MPDELEVHQGVRPDGVGTVAVHGAIDISRCALLSQILTDMVGAGTPCIVVDLTDVTFMDSTGINALLLGHQATADAAGWLRLAGAQESVHRVIRLVGLDEVISTFPDVETASRA
jgi:anti-anti-sigma factor